MLVISLFSDRKDDSWDDTLAGRSKLIASLSATFCHLESLLERCKSSSLVTILKGLVSFFRFLCGSCHVLCEYHTGRQCATVLNGPLAGKEVYVSFGDDFRSHLTPFEYPAGETHPCWQGVGRYSTEMILDPDLVEDLGELSDDELKEKGLWMEPGTDAALKAAMKPFPEGMDEFVFDGVMGAAQTADVDAQLRLSQCYYEGAGVRKSRASAERWLEAAVEQTQRRDLELRLAFMYADDWGRRGFRMEKAEKIFRKYAEQGDADAQFCLGLLLECGYPLISRPPLRSPHRVSAVPRPFQTPVCFLYGIS